MALTLTTVAFFLAALLVSSPSAAAARALTGTAKHDIPAVFAFGDSTLDPGNNNRLNTLVRADHAPYGRDFPGGEATGRFSDGKLITDYIVESLGIKDLLPAYHNSRLTVAEATTGVSFASGGSGIDDLTAQTALVSTFGSQISDFQELLGRIGAPKSAEIANKSLYVLSAGTNDVSLYSVLPIRAGSFPTIDQYNDYLIGRLQSYIQSLYKLGARNFMVAGLPPVGCLPVQKSLQSITRGFEGCVADLNSAAEGYNSALQQMLTKLEAASPGVTLAYVDVYGPLKDMATQPQKYGFTETTLGCCGTGLVEMGALCTSLLPQCESPAQFMFFDSVHPTQATYKALADRIVQSHIPKFIK
ncbi:GDSL esterase/lipase At2g40250-like [Phragmites australis]|uniref:GDSL esterase/lipase At2g40250-like n=1 Tax=Phragmites australis TaxID=29695 RepID=UPI002D791B89|nr:GDSL esterase/lipase At2g40250-like [Phragmites australis]